MAVHAVVGMGLRRCDLPGRRPTGGTGGFAVYLRQAPGATDEGAEQGRVGIDDGTSVQEGQRMGDAQAPVARDNRRTAVPSRTAG
jgi:hypothetical protein